MLIIIDGYNVLKQTQTDDITENQRNAFINKIAKYIKKKGHKAIIVFDGGYFGWETKEKIRGVSILYSGYKQTADESIKQFISEHRNKNLLLVSSDRQLNHWADEAGVTSIDSHHFILLLKQALQKKQVRSVMKKKNIIKTSDSQNQELDQLMHEATQEIEVKEEDIEVVPIDQFGKKVSKKEKKQLKKIQKL